MRHPDFQKIYRAFMIRYGKSPTPCKEGEDAYYDWLRKLDLDETKPYGQSQRTREFFERFSWIAPHIEYIREDDEAKYYRVEALFPLTSMNSRVYTREELAAATRTFVGKPSNLNHTDEVLDIEIVDAQFEDDVVELLVRIPKTASCQHGNLCHLIDNAESEQYGIVNVSIEASSTRGVLPAGDGVQINGLLFTGLGWLTKDVLPGVPLTRILPVEKLAECYGCQFCYDNDVDVNTESGNNRPEGENMNEENQTDKQTEQSTAESAKPEDAKEKKTACETLKEKMLEKLATIEKQLKEMTGKEIDFAKDYADLKNKVAALDKKLASKPEEKPAEAPATETPATTPDPVATVASTPNPDAVEPPAAEGSHSHQVTTTVEPGASHTHQIPDTSGSGHSHNVYSTEQKPDDKKEEKQTEEINILGPEGFKKRVEQLVKDGAKYPEAVTIANIEVLEAVTKALTKPKQ